MRLYRSIATLSVLQVLCFLLLTHLEPEFFLLHFYQSIVYLALLILLFYTEDRWAYMIGMLAPAGWLIIAFATGLLGAAGRQLLRLERGMGLTNLVSFLAGITMVLSVLMIAVCARRWHKEYGGLGKSLTTFIVSLGIVVVYYGDPDRLVLAHDTHPGFAYLTHIVLHCVSANQGPQEFFLRSLIVLAVTEFTQT